MHVVAAEREHRAQGQRVHRVAVEAAWCVALQPAIRRCGRLARGGGERAASPVAGRVTAITECEAHDLECCGVVRGGALRIGCLVHVLSF